MLACSQVHLGLLYYFMCTKSGNLSLLYISVLVVGLAYWSLHVNFLFLLSRREVTNLQSFTRGSQGVLGDVQLGCANHILWSDVDPNILFCHSGSSLVLFLFFWSYEPIKILAHYFVLPAMWNADSQLWLLLML
jgi:hypothetical protein